MSKFYPDVYKCYEKFTRKMVFTLFKRLEAKLAVELLQQAADSRTVDKTLWSINAKVIAQSFVACNFQQFENIYLTTLPMNQALMTTYTL